MELSVAEQHHFFLRKPALGAHGRRLALIFPILVCFCIGIYFLSRPPGEPTEIPGLYVNARSLDFGAIIPNSEPRGSLILSNRGTEAIQIKGIYPECGCTSATVGSTMIQPGQSVPLLIAMNSSGESGYILKHITIKASSGVRDGNVVLTESAFVDPMRDLVVFPSVLDLGVVSEGQTASGMLFFRGQPSVLSGIPSRIDVMAGHDAAPLSLTSGDDSGEMNGKAVRIFLTVPANALDRSVIDTGLQFSVNGRVSRTIKIK